MRSRMNPMVMLFAVALLGVSAAFVMAQQAPAGNSTPGSQGNNRQNNWQQRMEQYRQRMSDRLKKSLGADDVTWKVLEPRIEKVRRLEMELRSGGRSMFGRWGRRGRGSRGRRGNNNGNAAQGGGAAIHNAPERQQPANPVAEAMMDLRATLEKKDASADQIKARLAALRDARKNVQGQLDKAQQDLRSLLSVQQEAQLVMMGVLE